MFMMRVCVCVCVMRVCVSVCDEGVCVCVHVQCQKVQGCGILLL